MNIISTENINESLSTHYLIYKITNNINGKYYIGQHKTTNPYDQYAGSGYLIHKAEEKYGISCFIKEILFDFDNFNEMNNKEKELVQLSNCFPYDQMSYNIKEGGYAGEMSEYAKQKMSTSRKQYFKNMTVEQHIKYSKRISEQTSGKNNPMYGKNIKDHMSKEAYEQWKAKVAFNNRIRAQSEESIKKFTKRVSGKNNPMYGHSVTEYMTSEKIKQWKNNISKATSGKNNPMYGKNIKDYMTKEAYDACLKKRSNSMKNRTIVNNGKIRKRIKNTELDTYLNNGWKLGWSLN